MICTVTLTRDKDAEHSDVHDDLTGTSSDISLQKAVFLLVRLHGQILKIILRSSKLIGDSRLWIP